MIAHHSARPRFFRTQLSPAAGAPQSPRQHTTRNLTLGDAMEATTKPITRLLVIGLLFHLIYIGTVFDCYFKSPVVHGMQPFNAGFSLAKRLVLIVGTRFETSYFLRRSMRWLIDMCMQG